MVRWILTRRRSWSSGDIITSMSRPFYTLLYGSALRSGLTGVPASTPIITGGCVGIARDVPGHRRVDLRCLRASCRPLRVHRHIREAAGRTGSALRVNWFRSKIWSQNPKFALGKFPNDSLYFFSKMVPRQFEDCCRTLTAFCSTESARKHSSGVQDHFGKIFFLVLKKLRVKFAT